MDDNRQEKKLSRDAKEAEHERLIAEIAALRGGAVEALKLLALHERDMFIRMACESELDIEAAEYNVFTAYRDASGKSTRVYPDLARIVLARLDGSNNIDDGRAYILLADYVAANISYRSIDEKIFDFGRKDPEFLIHRYFSSMERDFGLALLWACELVYHGMPLYYVDTDDGYEQLPFSHPDYVYLLKMGENFIQDRTTDLPYWSKKYYINSSHLRTHNLFFAHGGEIKAETVPALRKCLRDQIGVKDTIVKQGEDRTTALLEEVYEVMAEFGERRPYPKAIAIVGWLQDKHGLSERQASAIEIIARPDSTR